MTVNQMVSGSSPEGGAKRGFLKISKFVKIVQTHASTRFRGFFVSARTRLFPLIIVNFLTLLLRFFLRNCGLNLLFEVEV